MPWDWGTIFEYGAPILGGLLEGQGSKDAANAAARGDANAIAEQRRQFDAIMAMQAPYQHVGTQALNALGRLYGYSAAPAATTAPAGATQAGPTAFRPTGSNINGLGTIVGGGLGALTGAAALGPLAPLGIIGSLFNNTSEAERDAFAAAAAPVWLDRMRGGTGSSPKPSPLPTPGYGDMTGAGGAGIGAGSGIPDMSGFFASPDYNFRRGEGMRGIENSFAARGGAASGNALRALSDFNSNLAAGEFGNYFNRNAALAGIGQTATNNASNAAFNTGANIGNLLSSQGQSRASGIAGGTNALTSTLQNLLSVWQRRNPQNSMSL